MAALGLSFHVRDAKGRSKSAQAFRHTLRLRWVVLVVVVAGRQIHVSGAVGGALGGGRSCVLVDPVGALVWSAHCPAVHARGLLHTLARLAAYPSLAGGSAFGRCGLTAGAPDSVECHCCMWAFCVSVPAGLVRVGGVSLGVL